MKKVLIVYKSKTGFTKKYVDWICEEVTCDTRTLNEAKTSDIDKYDIIIYGAGIHAGFISGLKKFKKLVDINSKKVIVFATGAAPISDDMVQPVIENNLAECKSSVRFFYFESGLCYEKMGAFSRGMMKIFSKMLNARKDKSEFEDGMSTAIMSSYDNSKKENIEPLITLLNECLVKLIPCVNWYNKMIC